MHPKSALLKRKGRRSLLTARRMCYGEISKTSARVYLRRRFILCIVFKPPCFTRAFAPWKVYMFAEFRERSRHGVLSISMFWRSLCHVRVCSGLLTRRPVKHVVHGMAPCHEVVSFLRLHDGGGWMRALDTRKERKSRHDLRWLDSRDSGRVWQLGRDCVSNCPLGNCRVRPTRAPVPTSTYTTYTNLLTTCRL